MARTPKGMDSSDTPISDAERAALRRVPAVTAEERRREADRQAIKAQKFWDTKKNARQ